MKTMLITWTAGITAVAGLTVALLTGLDCDRKDARHMDAASTVGKPSGSGRREVATFGAGCFWGVEAAFRRVEGVLETEVGYSGGHTKDPTYKQVCTGRTGHTEVVRVVFDPAKVSYEQLLDVFWNCHDPTQVNRQGPDVGRQYRSVIFYHTKAQAAAARAAKGKLDKSGTFRRPIATRIEPAAKFYRAEAYHQQYLEKRDRASCPSH